MFTYELVPGIILDHWVFGEAEELRTDSAAAMDFLRGLVHLREALDSLINSPEGVLMIVTADFVDTIKTRNEDQDAYTVDRGSGMVGGRTTRFDDHIEVVLNGIFLLTSNDDGDAIINESGFELAGHTVVHEAQHVLMHQRRGCLNNDVDRSEVRRLATNHLYDAGTQVADEYRAEAAAYPLRRGARERFDFRVMASAAATEINTALDIYDDNGDCTDLMARVLNACQPLWVGLAYFAASLRKADGTIGPLPLALAKSRLWVRYVGERWTLIANVFGMIPDARQQCPPDLLQAIAERMIEVTRSLLLQMGFTFEDGNGNRAEFLIRRRDFPR